ncbi:MAG: tetratricopeptide repeat protein [Bacteroidota bacterium]
MLNYKKVIFIFVTLFILTVQPGLYAQKNKSKRERLTETKLREAESFFTEGEKYYILEDYAKALVLFQKSLDINDDNATVHFKIAQILSEGNELQKALKSISKAIELDPENKYFYILKADLHTQLGDFENASMAYEEMIGRIEKTEQYLFELAALYLYQARYDDALKAYDKIENAYGLTEEVIFQKQKIYLQNNDLDNALNEGQKLIDAFPGEQSYVLKQIEILIANDKIKKAQEELQRFLNESPNNAQARLVSAELKRKNGDFSGALEDLVALFETSDLSFENKIQVLAEYRAYMNKGQLGDYGIKLARELIEKHQEEASAYAMYGDILQALGKSDEARQVYINGLKYDQSNFAVWQNVIQLTFDVNKLDSVIHYSEKALELFPNQSAFYYYNGVANLQKRNYQEAVAALEQGKRLSSANLGLVSAFNGALGDAYNGAEEYEKSDKAYEAALDFDPNNDGILNNYSYYLALRKDKLDQAEKMAEKVVKNNPENATYLDTYAWVLFMRQKYKEAKKVMQKAFDKDPTNVSAIHYEHFGDILFKLGNIDEAVKNWKIAKGMNPKAELIDQKIAQRKLND